MQGEAHSARGWVPPMIGRFVPRGGSLPARISRQLPAAAEGLVRAPLLIAGVVCLLLIMEAAGMAGAHSAARSGVRSVLACYLVAGILNLTRFPRVLRGPPTRAAADRWLLDGWTAITALVAAAAVAEGSCEGLP